MDAGDREAIRTELRDHAESVYARVERRWGEFRRLDPLPVDPLSHHEVAFPDSAGAFLDEFYDYAAGAAVADAEGRLLCVHSEVRDAWETPGGAADPGETPAETARRETREETGVDPELTGVLYAQTMKVDLGRPERLPIPVVVFTGRPASGSALSDAELDEHGEVADLAWFGPATLPEDLRGYEPVHEHLRSLADGDGRSRMN